MFDSKTANDTGARFLGTTVRLLTVYLQTEHRQAMFRRTRESLKKRSLNLDIES